MTKVYCSECKFFYHYRDSTSNVCKAEETWESDPIREYKYYARPREKNANNDCRDFVQKVEIKELLKEAILKQLR